VNLRLRQKEKKKKNGKHKKNGGGGGGDRVFKKKKKKNDEKEMHTGAPSHTGSAVVHNLKEEAKQLWQRTRDLPVLWYMLLSST